MTEEQLQALRREHREVYVMKGATTTVAFRGPTRAEFDRFDSTSTGDEARKAALVQLALDVVVYPSRDEFLAMLEFRPALAVKVGGEALRVAADLEVEFAKKA